MSRTIYLENGAAMAKTLKVLALIMGVSCALIGLYHFVLGQWSVPVRMLSGVFLLGGIGRVISYVDVGRPHWMQLAEGAVELALPFAFFWLAAADEQIERSQPNRR